MSDGKDLLKDQGPEAPEQASGLSPVSAPAGSPDGHDDPALYDDERSPLAPEDDHSGADFDIADEVEAKLGAADEIAVTPAPPVIPVIDEQYCVHDDDPSPMECEDDHSGADFDIADEVEAKLGAATEPALSPPAPPPSPADADEDDYAHHAHDDDHSPLDHEDDHSGADDLHGLDTEHIHPGLAAALGASYAYARDGMDPDEDAVVPGGPAGGPSGAPDGDSTDAEACTPLEPEDSGEDDDALPDALLCEDEGRGTDKGMEDRPDESPAAPLTKEAAIAAAAAQAAGAATVADDDDDDDNGDDDEHEEDEEEGGGEDESDHPMTLRDHLTELRKRLFRAFMWIVLGFVICYPFAEQLFDLLFQPLMKAMPEASKLIYTSPPEAFFTFMKVAFVGGIFCTSPLVFYQLWAFIAPGLYKEEKMYILPVAVFSALFFISGGAFCYFVVFPFAFEFFMSYNQGLIQAMPSLNETLSFVLQLLLAFGLVFELPLFVFFLSKLGIITADMMRKFRRYALLVMVIIAAILTPPDVVSQLLMAGPLMLLYEASILIAAVFGKKKETPEDEGDDDEYEDEDDADEEDTPRRVATQQEQG